MAHRKGLVGLVQTNFAQQTLVLFHGLVIIMSDSFSMEEE